jgi:hypothetical protein
MLAKSILKLFYFIMNGLKMEALFLGCQKKIKIPYLKKTQPFCKNDGTTLIGQLHNIHWKNMGHADFNNDGFESRLFRHNKSGQLYFWSVRGGEFLKYEKNLHWKIISLNDMNADTHIDIVCRNDQTGAKPDILWFNQKTTKFALEIIE